MLLCEERMLTERARVAWEIRQLLLPALSTEHSQVLARGLWKPNGDEETEMQKTQRKRSLVLKDRVGA